jgi:5-methylcytosine-specific restriction enzyme subunit McrC
MSYLTVEEALPTIRGRVRFIDQTRRRFTFPLPVEVTFDEFSADIAENRILKAALRRCARFRVRDRRLHRRVHEALVALEGVSDVTFDPRTTEAPTTTRLNKHYEVPVAIALTILSEMTADLEAGSSATSTFLLDMDKVFEDFLYRALGDALPALGLRWKQGRQTTLDVDGQITIRPDLSLWRGTTCRFVADAKYKETDVGENDDLYQLLSYVRALGLRDGMLVYAAMARGAKEHVVRHDGSRLHVRTLDLTLTEPELLAQVGELAQLIADLTLSAPAQPALTLAP